MTRRLATLAVAALVLAACGSSGDAADEQSEAFEHGGHRRAAGDASR